MAWLDKWIIPIVVALVVIVGSAFLWWCLQEPSTETRQAKSSAWSKVEYDGHLWVTYETGFARSIQHHPDCECGR